MKNLAITAIMALLLPTAAFAVPGRSSLTCKSPAGAKKAITIKSDKYNVEGERNGFPSSASVEIGAIKVTQENEEGTMSGIVILNHPMDKVIAINLSLQPSEHAGSVLEIWAIPSSVRLSKRWDGEKPTDLNGIAHFKAKVTGSVSKDGKTSEWLEDAATVNCILRYDSGSAG